ncbi:MAG: Trm112 family protein [Chloroflexi bacterium]|nr:Trm112 family protein [Chloroflexota bacterium]
MAVSPDLLEILRCPADVRNAPNAGLLELVRAETAVPFLVCRDCGRKYPIKNDIPIMLIEEGDKYQALSIEQLPTSV